VYSLPSEGIHKQEDEQTQKKVNVIFIESDQHEPQLDPNQME